MPARKGLLAPQNTFLDTIATRFDGTHSNFVLGNAKIPNQPIVYCSDGFCDLTGYSRLQIMQKSCACDFLYGPKTDVQHQEAILRALREKQELKLEVILYKSAKSPFWCLLDIVPIQDEKHEVVLFLCSHKDITKQKLQEEKRTAALLHAGKAAPDQQPLQGTDPEVGGPEGAAAATAADKSSLALVEEEFPGLDSFSDGQEQDDMYGPNDEQSGADQDKHTANLYSRRRSRAVLYQLSGHYGQSRRNVNMKSKLKLNNRMNIPEYKTTTIEKRRFLLSHYGLGKSCWDWLILAVSFYVAIVVPYNATFKDKLQQDSAGSSGECKIDSIDILVELVFVVDVVLNFRTTFVNRKGEVVTVPKTICKHYIRSWFVVDACAALPFDLLCSLNMYSRSRVDLNLVKLIRLLRLARLLQKMDRYSQYSYIILTLLMLIFSLLAHWCACIWYLIAIKETGMNPPEWRVSWLHQLRDKLGENVFNTTDMMTSYVTALYFTTSSLTSVGFGNVSANTNTEKIFSIVIMLIGALMHAVVFGNVTALIRVMYARRSNYQTRLRDLKDFFRLHQLPKDLQQRMSDYFQTTWSLNHGIETSEILRDFPEELRGDVSLHLHREVLSLPIFETAPQGFLKSLARHIESKFCCPTEYLIHRRDALNYLYLVCNGSMEVLQDNMVVAILGKGDLVGYDVTALATSEPALYGGPHKSCPSGGLVKSRCDLKALTYCDLKCIQISGLFEVLKMYPEFSETFHREIIHDLSFNLREEGQASGSTGPTDTEHDNESGSNQYGVANHQPATMMQLPPSYPAASSKALPGARMGQLYTSASGGADTATHTEDEDETLNDEEDEEEEDDDDEDDDDDEEDDEEEEEEEGEDGDEGEEGDDDDDDDESNDDGGAGTGSSNRGVTNNSARDNQDEGHRKRATNEATTEKLTSPSGSGSKPVEGASSSKLKRQRRDTGVFHGLLKRVESIDRGSINDEQGLISPDNSSLSAKSFDCILGGRALTRGVVSRKPLAALRPALVDRLTGGAPSKPPLSFDLSRNTTALVDRRRRSAGCITRAMLAGHLDSPNTRRSPLESELSPPMAHSSSSAHAPARQKTQFGRRPPNHSVATRTTTDNGVSNGSSTAAASSLGGGRKAPRKRLPRIHRGAPSEFSLENIDARVSAISASVCEMRQELSGELNQFRASLRLLMQLLAAPQQPYRARVLPQIGDCSQRACQLSAAGSGTLARSRSSASLGAGGSRAQPEPPPAMGRRSLNLRRRHHGSHQRQDQTASSSGQHQVLGAGVGAVVGSVSQLGGSSEPLIRLASWRAPQQWAANEGPRAAAAESPGERKSIKAGAGEQGSTSLAGSHSTTSSTTATTGTDRCGAGASAKIQSVSGQDSLAAASSISPTLAGNPRGWLPPGPTSESLDSGRSSSSINSAASSGATTGSAHHTQLLLLSSSNSNNKQVVDTVALKDNNNNNNKHSSGAANV